MARPLLISVHDVMPATLDHVEQVFRELERTGLLPVTLLVVPATGWNTASIGRLRALVASGAELAGHGWHHAVEEIRGLRHRMHSRFISRGVAEHLALDRDGIVRLIGRCHAWFGDNGLPLPRLYVPPAWALGDVQRDDLARLPFALYETLGGVIDGDTGRLRRIPMAGYEADTALRAAACRAWNAFNVWSAGEDRLLRIAVHPRDLRLRLAADLQDMLAAGGRALSYGEIDARSRSRGAV